MSTHRAAPSGRLVRAGAVALLLAVAGCAQAPTTSSVAIPPIPAGEARFWFFRDFEPGESLGVSKIALNGAYAAMSLPGGASYRDVPPGHYHIAVDSTGQDVNQSKDVDLGPGQEAYVKILSLRSWMNSGDQTSRDADTFYVSLAPPDTAKAQIAQSPFYGGS